MTDKLGDLYRAGCRHDDARMLADLDAGQLIDLAEGRLAGEARARLVEAIAASPALAAAYRVARASGDWSRVVSADLAGKPAGGNVHALPLRPAAVAPRRHTRWALAAAVSAMAIGAVFVSQQMRAPTAAATDDVIFAAILDKAASDDILATSFDAGDGSADGDRIFSTRMPGNGDAIFDQSFGNGS